MYITKNKSNRIKVSCVDVDTFSPLTDYLFTFTGCKEHTMTLNGSLCEEYIEFEFEDNCNGLADINLPYGKYCLTITDTTDSTIIYKSSQVRVQV